MGVSSFTAAAYAIYASGKYISNHADGRMMRAHTGTPPSSRKPARTSALNDIGDDLPNPSTPAPLQRPPRVVWIPGGPSEDENGLFEDEVLEEILDWIDSLPCREPYHPHGLRWGCLDE